MKLHIIALRDIKANVYGQPQFVPNIGSAIRSFGDECTREARDNTLWMHPEDFELYHIGVYDDQDASIDPTQGPDFKITTGPVQLAVGSNYKK